MFEMTCPSCGAGGRVPRDKINVRLLCKKCLKPFHLSPTGRAVAGDPPITGVTTLAAPATTVDKTREVDEFFNKIYRFVFSPKFAILLTALIGLTVATAYMSGPGVESLEERVKRLARAAVEGDVAAIRALAPEATASEAAEWYEAVRPQFERLKQGLDGSEVLIAVAILQEDPVEGRGQVVARVTTTEDLSRRGIALPDPTISLAARPTIELPLAWTTDGGREWKFDGKRSLDLLGPQR